MLFDVIWIFNIILTTLIMLLALLMAYGVVLYINHVYQLRNYPPGPFPLPIIGNLHKLMGEKPYKTFSDLAKVYGDVFSVSMGMERVVIINTIELVKEALTTKSVEFAGKPTDNYMISLLTRGNRNISFADYVPHWKLNRKMAHSALGIHGDDIGKIDRKVTAESEKLCLRLKETVGEPVDMGFKIDNAVGNVVFSVVLGESYEINDPRFLEIIRYLDLLISGFNWGGVMSYIPWIRHFVRLEGLEKVKKGMKIRDGILQRQLENHRKTFNPGNIRDLTDSLIKISNEKEVHEVTDDNIQMVMSDIFAGGIHTTAGTLRWCVLYVLHWPKYQDLIYDEIVATIGTNRYPLLSDRHSLPILQATIQETLRLSSIIPMVLHKTTKDVTIDGDKHIPQNTQVMINFWNVHHAEGEWVNPHDFNPYRWLDEDNKCNSGRYKSYMPFGGGRRGCLGEQLAKSEIFLIFSRLMRDFKISPNTDEPFPSLEEAKSYVMLRSQDFTVRLSLRPPVDDNL